MNIARSLRTANICNILSILKINCKKNCINTVYKKTATFTMVV